MTELILVDHFLYFLPMPCLKLRKDQLIYVCDLSTLQLHNVIEKGVGELNISKGHWVYWDETGGSLWLIRVESSCVKSFIFSLFGSYLLFFGWLDEVSWIILWHIEHKVEVIFGHGIHKFICLFVIALDSCIVLSDCTVLKLYLFERLEDFLLLRLAFHHFKPKGAHLAVDSWHRFEVVCVFHLKIDVVLGSGVNWLLYFAPSWNGVLEVI